MHRLAGRDVRSDSGFTLIELLVVILIIGILAAIAIPSFLNQKGKAYDASAKELARTAQTTAETYATDHNGEYTELNGEGAKKLHEYESSLAASSGEAKGGSYISAVSATASSYTVTATAANTGDTFSVERNSSGVISRTCSSTKKGCSGANSGSW
ncbi:MAG TPA: type II secretion system protein [Solirubrobacteraceae bacterium]|nr:type II secretion system protein [Solirubrobacteraceae bacterium]